MILGIDCIAVPRETFIAAFYALRRAERFIKQERREIAASSCLRLPNGKPDLATMDPMSKREYRRVVKAEQAMRSAIDKLAAVR
jgi:hypothetical protein